MTTQTAVPNSMPSEKKAPLIQKILIVAGMVSLMAGSLTGVMTYMNVGVTESFMTDWLSSFLSAAVVMPFGFIFMGIITALIEKQMPNTSERRRNLITGVIMAVVMESIMAFATAFNNIGFAQPSEFFSGWLNGFMAALPLGLTLVITISMTIKPKIERILKS